MSQPVTIIMIEDDEGHARLIERNIRRSGVNNEIVPFSNGTAAVNYLFGSDGTGLDQKGRALLILLDLNLPGMDGRELLRIIKADERLRHIPVVVVTGSEVDADVLSSYQQHANAYVKKPIATKEFLEAVNSIEQFWLQIVRLP